MAFQQLRRPRVRAVRGTARNRERVGNVGTGHVVLLLPRRLEESFLHEQAADLAQSAPVAVVRTRTLLSLGCLPPIMARILAWLGAHTLRLPPGSRVFVVYHPWQVPLARALLARYPRSELWYSVWDWHEAGYSDGYYTGERLARRLSALHAWAASKAALLITASVRLAEVERAGGRAAVTVPLSADTFPAPDVAGAIIAASFGHHGRRTDWRLLRELAERMPDLYVLLIGNWTEAENRGDPNFAFCRELDNVAWLGYRSSAEAATLIMCADVGVVLYKQDDYNDAALPHKVLKYARLGRYAICGELGGALTWERAVIVCPTTGDWVKALRSQRGARARPDLNLQAWALEQTAELYDAALRARLTQLGIARSTV